MANVHSNGNGVDASAPRRRPVLAAGALALALLASACSSGSDGAAPPAAPGGPGSTPAATAGTTTTTGAPFTPRTPAAPITYAAQPAGLAWPTNGWETGPLPPGADAAKIDATLAKAFGEYSVGQNQQFDAVVVVQGGRIVVERYRPGFGGEATIHRSWSMAKSFTGTLMGVLVRQGRIDIYDPAPVPQWSDPADPRHAITTDQLMRMASGLKFKEEYFAPDSDTVAMLSGAAKDDMAAFAANQPLEAEPGTRVQYSTGTSCILAGIIGDEVGHGDAYRSFIRTELLDPLGIPEDGAAPGFDGKGNLIGGSVFDMTARNFAKFGYLMLRGGTWDGREIVSPSWIDYERTQTPAPAGAPNYGAQWWVSPSNPAKFRAGGFGGQHIVVLPQQDLVVVVLSDRLDGKDGEIRDELIDAFAGVTATP